MDYLVFRLYGPLASWGVIAVGESRHSASYPGKSALVGLLGAALGIRREEEAQQQALANGYRFAVKLISNGSLLRDYHTTQVPDSAGKRIYRTRRDELIHGRDRLGTNLSAREYRCDSQAVIAVSALEAAPYSLQQIQTALIKPRFQLSLGRKSCVLAAPLAPEIVVSDGYRGALNTYSLQPMLDEAPVWNSDERWLPQTGRRYYWEGAAEDFDSSGEDFDPDDVQLLIRHDQPRSRARWQFAPRQEFFWQEPELREDRLQEGQG